jgi:hypothetical protein
MKRRGWSGNIRKQRNMCNNRDTGAGSEKCGEGCEKRPLNQGMKTFCSIDLPCWYSGGELRLAAVLQFNACFLSSSHGESFRDRILKLTHISSTSVLL